MVPWLPYIQQWMSWSPITSYFISYFLLLRHNCEKILLFHLLIIRCRRGIIYLKLFPIILSRLMPKKSTNIKNVLNILLQYSLAYSWALKIFKLTQKANYDFKALLYISTAIFNLYDREVYFKFASVLVSFICCIIYNYFVVLRPYHNNKKKKKTIQFKSYTHFDYPINTWCWYAFE